MTPYLCIALLRTNTSYLCIVLLRSITPYLCIALLRGIPPYLYIALLSVFSNVSVVIVVVDTYTIVCPCMRVYFNKHF